MLAEQYFIIRPGFFPPTEHHTGECKNFRVVISFFRIFFENRGECLQKIAVKNYLAFLLVLIKSGTQPAGPMIYINLHQGFGHIIHLIFLANSGCKFPIGHQQSNALFPRSTEFAENLPTQHKCRGSRNLRSFNDRIPDKPPQFRFMNSHGPYRIIIVIITHPTIDQSTGIGKLLKEFDLLFDFSWQIFVVVIQKSYIFTRRYIKSLKGLQRRPSLLQSDVFDLFIPIRAYHFSGIVGRSTVDNYMFIVPIRLPPDAFDGPVDQIGPVIGYGNDRDQRAIIRLHGSFYNRPSTAWEGQIPFTS